MVAESARTRTHPSTGKGTTDRASRFPLNHEELPDVGSENVAGTSTTGALMSSRKAQVEQATAAKTEDLTKALLAALETIQAGQL
jgi:hypothetical protein